jgi:uncharacterized protein
VAESIVVNAGPLIALARAGALDIVGRLLITYVCPMQVRTELDEGARSGYLDIRVPWLEVVPLTTPLDAVSMATLDAGEAAVIQLARERSIEWVCIDDRKGRRAALAVGLRVTGSLGLLIRAKIVGLVPAVRPFVERAMSEGVWYDPDLTTRVLADLGE